MDREIVAVLVDGEFYLKRAKWLWGDKSPRERAEELSTYCNRHLKEYDGTRDIYNKLYRIFFYDCPPSDRNIFHPLLNKDINLKKTPMYAWRNDFHKELRKRRKVALRLGRLSDNDYYYTLSPTATKKLIHGSKKISDLTEEDFINNIGQKGVDMRLGLDIQSMALKKQVSRMILISGDSDFVPAAKEARREGVDFILDPLFACVSSDLSEHIDGLHTRCANPHTHDASHDRLAAGVVKKAISKK